MRPEHGRRALLGLEHNDAEDNGDDSQRRRDNSGDRYPLERDLKDDVRNHQRDSGEGEEAMILHQKLHDLHVSGPKLALFRELDDPIAVDELNHEIHDCKAERYRGKNADIVTELTHKRMPRFLCVAIKVT